MDFIGAVFWKPAIERIDCHTKVLSSVWDVCSLEHVTAVCSFLISGIALIVLHAVTCHLVIYYNQHITSPIRYAILETSVILLARNFNYLLTAAIQLDIGFSLLGEAHTCGLQDS